MIKKILLTIQFFLLFSLDPAWAKIAIDGVGCQSTSTSGNTISCSITTFNTSDVLIAYGKSMAGDTNNITTISGGAVTWKKRQSGTWGTGQGYDEWWGVTSGILSSAPITATWDGNPSKLAIIAISEANIASPFDQNASLPAEINSGAGSLTSVTSGGISTYNFGDILITALYLDNISLATPPLGFTVIAIGGSGSMQIAYKIISAPTSFITYGWSAFGSSDLNFQFDAIIPQGLIDGHSYSYKVQL